MDHCLLLKSREGKDPSAVECVTAFVSKLAQETLESSTLNDKHRLGFRRVLASAARIWLYARIFLSHTFHVRDSEAELGAKRTKNILQWNRRIRSEWRGWKIRNLQKYEEWERNDFPYNGYITMWYRDVSDSSGDVLEREITLSSSFSVTSTRGIISRNQTPHWEVTRSRTATLELFIA